MRWLGLMAAAATWIATPAFAMAPACNNVSIDPGSPAIGRWTLNQDDDGPTAPAGPWTVNLRADGTFAEDGDEGGNWCVVDGVLIVSFDEAPHTTYRGAIGGRTIRGTESWDGGGTGVFTLQRMGD